MIFLRGYKTYIKRYDVLAGGMCLSHVSAINHIKLFQIMAMSYNSGVVLRTPYTYESFDEWQPKYNTYAYYFTNLTANKIINKTLRFKINRIAEYYGKQYTDDHLILDHKGTELSIRAINMNITYKRLKKFIKKISDPNYPTCPLPRFYVNGKFRNTARFRADFYWLF